MTSITVLSVLRLLYAYEILLQDAHEFLCQCLDQLKEEMAKVNKGFTNDPMVFSSGGKSGQDSVSPTTKLGGLEEVSTSHLYSCPVVDNMEFEVQHTITCKRWGLHTLFVCETHISVLHFRYWYQNLWAIIIEHPIYSLSHLNCANECSMLWKCVSHLCIQSLSGFLFYNVFRNPRGSALPISLYVI